MMVEETSDVVTEKGEEVEMMETEREFGNSNGGGRGGGIDGKEEGDSDEVEGKVHRKMC